MLETLVKIDYEKRRWKNAKGMCNPTDDLESSLKDLKSKGVELIHETPQDCPVGVYAAFRDPFGNVHELIEFRA